MSPSKQTVSLNKQTASLSKQSSSVLINMTSNQSKETNCVSDMEIDSTSLIGSSETGSSEKSARKSPTTDILKRSPVMTRKRSLSRTRKPEPAQTETADVKPSAEELSQSVKIANVANNKHEVIVPENSKVDSESHKVNDTSKQISSSKPVHAPKGLRPTIKPSQKKPLSRMATTVTVKPETTLSDKPGLSNQTGITVHRDSIQDEKSNVNDKLKQMTRTNLSSNKTQSLISKPESSSLLKSGTLTSSSKLLGDLDQSQPLTRAQSKLLDTTQTKVGMK